MLVKHLVRAVILMYITYNRFREAMKLVVVFLVLTFIFYRVVTYMSGMIRPAEPYKEPEGKALKVIKQAHSSELAYEDVKQRLFAFYWYGE
jgi:hypothetical protein